MTQLNAYLPQLARRLWITVAVLAVAFGGAFFFLQWASSSEVRELHKRLVDFPMQIGQWTGEDREMDEIVVQQVNARESISRAYHDSLHRSVFIHIASWSALGSPTLPHPPKVCYPAAGVTIIDETPVTVGEGDDQITARLLVTEREGQRTLVLYWYFWDSYVVATRWEATTVRLRLSGRREWPPVVKILLDAPVTGSEDETRERLVEFAGHVRAWTKDL